MKTCIFCGKEIVNFKNSKTGLPDRLCTKCAVEDIQIVTCCFENGNIYFMEYFINYRSRKDICKSVFIQYRENGNIYFENFYVNNSYGDDLLHREDDKPAHSIYHENGNICREEYYISGDRHRANHKPAVIGYDKNGNISYEEYWIYGRKYKK